MYRFQTSSLLLHLGQQQTMAQVPGALPTWETWSKLLASLQPGPGVVVLWGVIQQLEDLSPSLCYYAFPIKQIFF